MDKLFVEHIYHNIYLIGTWDIKFNKIKKNSSLMNFSSDGELKQK